MLSESKRNNNNSNNNNNDNNNDINEIAMSLLHQQKLDMC